MNKMKRKKTSQLITVHAFHYMNSEKSAKQ